MMEEVKDLQVILADYAGQASISYSDALASQLYNHYTEGDLIDDPALWEHYEGLKNSVTALPTVIRDEILSAAEKLAAYQEERAFRAGLQLGFSRIKR